MALFEKVKAYFDRKKKGEDAAVAPEGVCPNCWGKQEWDGEYYKFIKGEGGDPSRDTYTSFIQDVTRKLDKITIKKDTYSCENCKVKYD